MKALPLIYDVPSRIFPVEELMLALFAAGISAKVAYKGTNLKVTADSAADRERLGYFLRGFLAGFNSV